MRLAEAGGYSGSNLSPPGASQAWQASNPSASDIQALVLQQPRSESAAPERRGELALTEAELHAHAQAHVHAHAQQTKLGRNSPAGIASVNSSPAPGASKYGIGPPNSRESQPAGTHTAL